MPRSCSICSHAEREAINTALVANEPYRTIADRYGLSHQALMRHKAEHLPAVMVKSEQAKEVAHADDLVAQVKGLRSKAVAILMKAEAAGELKTALLGIREARACIELLAELEGALSRTPLTINLVVTPEWIKTRTVLMHALGDFPEARAAAARALIEVDRGI